MSLEVIIRHQSIKVADLVVTFSLRSRKGLAIDQNSTPTGY